jgi:hypothetical protein
MTTTRSSTRRSTSGSTLPTEESSASMAEQTVVSDAAASAGQAVSQVADSARQTVSEQANSQRLRAAEGITRTAEAIRRVSGDLEAQQPAIAGLADGAAEQAERIGRYLRETDVTDIVNTTQDFARRQPLLFYGGALALGMIAARVIKAAAGRPAQPWSGQAAYSRSSRSSVALQPTGPGASELTSGIRATGSTAS